MPSAPGWNEGMAAGLEREAQLFAEAVVDKDGGKTGIREFIDKKSPPLPVRRNGVYIDSEHEAKGERLGGGGRPAARGRAVLPRRHRRSRAINMPSASPAMPKPARRASASRRRTSAS